MISEAERPESDFFFSSIRRHTRYWRDWSSDVCSSDLQKQFVQDYEAKYKDYPHWEADRAYFAMEVYRAGVEAAYKAKNAWPSTEDIINAMEGVRVESLGGPGQMRKDHIPEQTFYQGLTTHKNRYDFATLGSVEKMYSDQ